MKNTLSLKVQLDGEGATGRVSDGYHTFDELYDHRIALFIALCRKVVRLEELAPSEVSVWRSLKHFVGPMFEGHFIMGIHSPACGLITYHLPLARWGETDFAAPLQGRKRRDTQLLSICLCASIDACAVPAYLSGSHE